MQDSYQRQIESDPERYQRRLELDQQANTIFERLGQEIQKSVSDGARDLDVMEVAKAAGLDLPAEALQTLGLPQRWITHPFLPWYAWFPWQSLWLYHWSVADPESPAAEEYQALQAAQTADVTGQAAGQFATTQGPAQLQAGALSKFQQATLGVQRFRSPVFSVPP
jgi:hypothetical protein